MMGLKLSAVNDHPLARGHFRVPPPISAGLILSYQCNAACRHCMYACSSHCGNEWISETDLEIILAQLARTIESSPFGPDSLSLSHGLHFTGGEPFLNFSLLSRAVEMAEALRIPSTFVETNCFWARDREETFRKLQHLKDRGLKGIMISVNPFYLEYVPFERTRRCVEMSWEVFGENTMVYQLAYYNRFLKLGIAGKLSLDEYFHLEKNSDFLSEVEFFLMGRAPYQMGQTMSRFFEKHPASFFFYQPCQPPFIREWHNHIDLYGNFIPGFCGGISMGDARQLAHLMNDGVDLNRRPVLKMIIENNFSGLLDFAREFGYREKVEGYYSKCHLCVDLRRHLALNGEFPELRPEEFYLQLD